MRPIIAAALLIALTACGTKQVDLAEQSADSSCRTVLLREVEYDQKGLPLFSKTLSKRPIDPGERFTIGLFRGTMPVKTFDIAITRSRGDLMVPLRVVYHWTGEGFKAGAAIGFVLASVLMDATDDEGHSTATGKELAGAVVIPTAVGTAGGFVVGLAKSTPSGFAETEKIILRARESVVTYTVYEHNGQGQLSRMTMYEPGTRAPIVKTEFYYGEDRTIPEATYITSYPEGKVRVIDRQGTREGEVLR